MNVQHVIARTLGVACALLSSVVAGEPENEGAAQVSFQVDIAPLLKRNCLACHNASLDESGVNLESVQSMKDSDVADVVLAGKPESSLLYLVAAHESEPVMPPEENDVGAQRFTAAELGLLRAWIEQGAKYDASNPQRPGERGRLPEDINTIYAAAATPDLGLTAVGFGNRIAVFQHADSRPLAQLERGDQDTRLPAHDDFVQALGFAHAGKTLVSAGASTVRLWGFDPVRQSETPTLDLSHVAAFALNQGGTHGAAVSRKGEVSVFRVGDNRWEWLKTIELSAPFLGESDYENPMDKPKVAVDSAGEIVAVGMGTQIQLVALDSREPVQLHLQAPVGALCWTSEANLIAGDEQGAVHFFENVDGTWSRSDKTLFQGQAVVDFLPQQPSLSSFVAIAADGQLVSMSENGQSISDLGHMPEDAEVLPGICDGASAWAVSQTGHLRRYDFGEQSLVTLDQTDPVVQFKKATAEWQVLAAEKRLATNKKQLDEVKGRVEAEEKNLEQVGKDLVDAESDRESRSRDVAMTETVYAHAKQSLADAKQAVEDNKSARAALTAAIGEQESQIAALQQELCELESQRDKAQTQLLEIADEESLSADLKTAEKSAEEQRKVLESQQSELEQATSKTVALQQRKELGQERLDEVREELSAKEEAQERCQTTLASAQESATELAKRVENAAPADGGAAMLGSDGLFVTRSKGSGVWSLWAKAGNYIGPMPELDGCTKILDSAAGTLALENADGQLTVVQATEQLWRLKHTIVPERAESRIPASVSCIDLSEVGGLLATGGGVPSRTGDLELWNLEDGSLVRRIDQPHKDIVMCVRFSPDGKLLASGGADRMIRVWDVASGELVKTLEGHTHHVTALDWSIDQTQMASASADMSVKIWDLRLGKSTRTISDFRSEVTQLRFLGAEDRLGLVSANGSFRVYKTDNGSREANAAMGLGYLYALATDWRGTKFVIGGSEGQAVVVDNRGQKSQDFRLDAIESN